jgi:hypothetical protein
MNDFQKLKLQEMIKANDVEDQTNKIRELKHSDLIRRDMIQMQLLKKQASSLRIDSPDKFNELCVEKCNFLFSHYPDIFNKLKKDEINLQIFDKFLRVLKQVENNEIDQHQGSFIIGNILKELYIDTALRRDEKNSENSKSELVEPISNISWSDFKKQI